MIPKSVKRFADKIMRQQMCMMSKHAKRLRGKIAPGRESAA